MNDYDEEKYRRLCGVLGAKEMEMVLPENMRGRMVRADMRLWICNDATCREALRERIRRLLDDLAGRDS